MERRGAGRNQKWPSTTAQYNVQVQSVDCSSEVRGGVLEQTAAQQLGWGFSFLFVCATICPPIPTPKGDPHQSVASASEREREDAQHVDLATSFWRKKKKKKKKTGHKVTVELFFFPFCATEGEKGIGGGHTEVRQSRVALHSFLFFFLMSSSWPVARCTGT